MKLEACINVPLGGGYDVFIGSGLLEEGPLFKHVKALGLSLVIITDDRVRLLYGQRLLELLKAKGFETHLLSIGHGEHAKTRMVKEHLEDKMLSLGLGRDTVIIAIGGGVVLDLAGFLAATYCRGIPALYIPTTTLAMVDASVGGKVGVNTKAGKNLIGTFAHPKAVFMDMDVLNTLDDKDYYGGLIEALKHALLIGGGPFKKLKRGFHEIECKDKGFLKNLIQKSVEIKRDIVVKDEFEEGLRACLNLGHTVAHALEIISEHRISHGPAVALGLLAEGKMAFKAGYLNHTAFQELTDIITPYLSHFTMELDGLTTQNLQRAMTMDKKTRKKKARFALISDIGVPLIMDGDYSVKLDKAAIEVGLQYILKEYG